MLLPSPFTNAARSLRAIPSGSTPSNETASAATADSASVADDLPPCPFGRTGGVGQSNYP
ncbi:uncharacterized protein SOCE836_056890 [Sorangium cellulosum]|uniref:Uncharacterized protein n=1 Tax=Sorangium cellulosum TaxID=56 RepID=A0A4P2QT93_SORCE|nr:uncharacterized protein SOCE836_056890 [Sorangium cellulosum]WCQ92845.1 hypothetical protein NQZ70_05591 [Sorangium sp. Soce836]